MADFWQGEIPTLHRLVDGRAEALVADLQPAAGARRVTLVLPCHVRDLHAAAFQEMLPALRSMTWLERIVLGLDGGLPADKMAADALLAGFPQRVQVCHGAAMGKGGNVQRCLQWVLAQGDAEVIALHDCDLSPYDPELLLRLVTPIARPEYGYRFAKGYYARFTDRLQGRLTRLWFAPLVAALAEAFPTEARWRMLAAWRYPLSGEMAFDAALAREFRIPQGWGLETGLLLESQRLLPLEHLCQVDLCARYDHRHQPLVAPSGGPCLADAAREILSTLLQSAPALPPHFHLHAAYLRHAERALQRSRHVARLNGLHFSELDERAACTAFLLAATGATV